MYSMCVKNKISNIVICIVINCFVITAQNNDIMKIDLGKNSFVINPNMNMEYVQSLLDTLYYRQAERKSEFNNNRYAIFFESGTYHLDVKVGYYMQVYELGISPEDVVIMGAVRSKSTRKDGNVLTNFWRSVENLTVVPTIDTSNIWGASQAAPLRRIYIKGNLQLHDGGYASGGFMANSKVEGTVFAGQQQQWFTRNSSIGKWDGGAWNMMYMGVRNTPLANWPTNPNIVFSNTPIVREKPYIVFNNKTFSLKVPVLRRKTVGYNWDDNQTKTLNLDEFYIANPDRDNTATLNSELQKGKNILFTPGEYSINQSLKISKAGTILYGIGMATLQSANGNSIVEVGDVGGVLICNLMLDAGSVISETLIRIGQNVSTKNFASNPVCLFDIYARVGGPFLGTAKSCMIINSNNVIVDNTWLWRADHGNGVGWHKNKGANGLIVNGNNVTVYGLFNEHFQEYQTIWNGENGKVYFYQCEMPYDPPSIAAWKNNNKNGFAAYKVSDHVKKHQAFGVGVYCYFNQAPIVADNSIETSPLVEMSIRNAFNVWLNGNKESIIKHIINGKGDSVNVTNRKANFLIE